MRIVHRRTELEQAKQHELFQLPRTVKIGDVTYDATKVAQAYLTVKTIFEERPEMPMPIESPHQPLLFEDLLGLKPFRVSMTGHPDSGYPHWIVWAPAGIYDIKVQGYYPIESQTFRIGMPHIYLSITPGLVSCFCANKRPTSLKDKVSVFKFLNISTDGHVCMGEDAAMTPPRTSGDARRMAFDFFASRFTSDVIEFNTWPGQEVPIHADNEFGLTMKERATRFCMQMMKTWEEFTEKEGVEGVLKHRWGREFVLEDVANGLF